MECLLQSAWVPNVFPQQADGIFDFFCLGELPGIDGTAPFGYFE
jgi:hypothetical protein